MLFHTILPLFSVSLVSATSNSVQVIKRQSNDSTSPFASITPSKTLEWTPCYADISNKEFGIVECARLIAPLDYSDESAGEVQLAIIKLSSPSGKSTRTVFYNPGGPGNSPVDVIVGEPIKIRAAVGNDTDIIGVVPRGVGATTPPIACDTSEDADSERANALEAPFPGFTDSAISDSYKLGESLGIDCNKLSSKQLPFIGTLNAARDLDYVLTALGQKQISYYGVSYGTTLGATYASLFPDKIDRMVLDGVVDTNAYYTPQNSPEAQAGDTDAALEEFFEACFNAGVGKCSLWQDSTEKIRTSFLQADERIKKEPLPIPDFGTLTYPIWRSRLWSALYTPGDYWQLLAPIVKEIGEGKAGPAIKKLIEVVAQLTTSLDPPILDPNTNLRNSPAAGTLIRCADAGYVEENFDLAKLTAEFKPWETVSKVAGPLRYRDVLICKGARISAKNQDPRKLDSVCTSSPILWVGNRIDPATPIRNAFKMSERFTGSRVLTINGVGHISYSTSDTLKCAKEYLLPYFNNLTLPPAGTICNSEQVFFP